MFARARDIVETFEQYKLNLKVDNHYSTDTITIADFSDIIIDPNYKPVNRYNITYRTQE